MGAKQDNQIAACDMLAALVSRLSLVLGPALNTSLSRKHVLVGELKFWRETFNFSVNKKSFAAEQALKAL